MNMANGGNMWAGWSAYLSFFRHVAKLPLDYSAWRHYETLAERSGWRVLHPEFCIISDRPARLDGYWRDGVFIGHRDGGMSHQWRDGWGFHMMNDVRVPAWLAEMAADQLDPLLFAQQENAEVRREFVRKVGVERLCAKLGTEVLDRQGDYELHLVDLKGETGKHPYLKMRNPSIGVYHMEAVSKECRTVKAALAFRNGGEVEHIAPLT
jgi:hypothetical protein